MSENISSSRSGLAILGVSLALGLIVAALILGGAFKSLKKYDQYLYVKGYAEKEITSDLAVWRISFSISTPDLASGYDKVQKDIQRISAYLESKGIAKNQIEVNSINTMVNYRVNADGISTGQREGFTLEQTIVITSKNVELINKTSKEVTELIREGIELQSMPPEYYFTKLNDMKVQMIGEASKDAKKRAEQLANNTGSSVGGLKSAEQGVFQITPLHSTEVSDFGSYDLSSIKKSIKAVVTMQYYID